MLWSFMPKSDATMFDEHVPLFKGPGVHQEFNPFPGSQFALGVLGLDAVLARHLIRRQPFFLLICVRFLAWHFILQYFDKSS